MINSVCSFVWCKTRIGIYSDVYLGSRVSGLVCHVTYNMYMYVCSATRNVHVHIVWYKAKMIKKKEEIDVRVIETG